MFGLYFDHGKKRLVRTHTVSQCDGLLAFFLCLASCLLFNTNDCEEYQVNLSQVSSTMGFELLQDIAVALAMLSDTPDRRIIVPPSTSQKIAQRLAIEYGNTPDRAAPKRSRPHDRGEPRRPRLLKFTGRGNKCKVVQPHAIITEETWKPVQ